MKARKGALGIAMLVVLGLVAFWAYSRMSAMRARAADCAQELGDCYRMSAQIERASRRPAVAAEHEKVATEITSVIEGAAKASQIPTEKIEQITPQAARRLGDTAYKEKPTQVILREVSLRQWVEFLHRLSASEMGLEVRSLRLVAPKKDDAGDVWLGEAEVTYLIYDPPRGPE